MEKMWLYLWNARSAAPRNVYPCMYTPRLDKYGVILLSLRDFLLSLNMGDAIGTSLSSPALLALVAAVDLSVGEYMVSAGLVNDGDGRVGIGGMLVNEDVAVAFRCGELVLRLRDS